jgi:1-acyl-sn-glycerol-3-phosphate acyltransferase
MLEQKLNYAWRVCATGLSFVGFGLGGIGIALLLPAALKLLSADPQQQQQMSRKVIKHSFRGFVAMLQGLGIMHYEIEGLAALEHCQGELLVANHPTLIDVVMLIAFLPQANCVVKQSLWSNLFTRGPVRSAGYQLNLGGVNFVEACVAKLQQSHAATLIIFPEGTRTEKHQRLNTFQRGAANIALRANVPIRPVLIRCTPSTLTKNEKWYHVPAQPFQVKLQVLEAIAPQDILSDLMVNPKNVRQLNAWLYDFFDTELSKCKT